MYFPYAFKQVLPAATTGSPVEIDIDTTITDTTADLSAGQIAIVDPKTYNCLAASPGNTQPFVIAMGSYYSNDQVGPHGGYKASVKTKVINPKYVHKFMKIEAKTPQNQIIALGWDLDMGHTQLLSFECGKTYRLRLDVKGSPALRSLTHHLYRTVDAYTGCCTDDCNSSCTGDLVDPGWVLCKWATAISEDSLLNKFIMAEVYWKEGAGTNVTPIDCASYVRDDARATTDSFALKLTVAYADTTFENCTFSVVDFYHVEPLRLFASLMDETGNPCTAMNLMNSSTGSLVTEIQPIRQVSGLGETVLRDYILSEHYRQNHFKDSRSADDLRKREIEGGNQFTAVTRSALYDIYLIQHTVPRFSNPTGTFDNDQYVIEIAVPTGTDCTTFETLVQDLLNDANSGVTLVTY